MTERIPQLKYDIAKIKEFQKSLPFANKTDIAEIELSRLSPEEALRKVTETTQEIANETLSKMPALGGGKPRSVTYNTMLCHTAGEIDEFLNQDAYAYSYIYWTPQAKGVFITLCKPNPVAFAARSAPRIELGLSPMTESDAIVVAKRMTPIDPDIDDAAEIAISRLYDEGFRLCRQVQRTVEP